jgi:hypothetical protein
MAFVTIAALLMVANGAAMLIYLSDRYMSPEFLTSRDWVWFTYLTFLTFVVGPWLLWSMVKRLTAPGPGIDKQEIDFQSPELKAAVDEAREKLPSFIEQARRHIDDAYIRFPKTTDKDDAEHVWGYVHHYENGIFQRLHGRRSLR